MYMVLGMMVLIMLIACSKVLFDRTIDIENEFQVAVIMPADSKYELKGVVQGINDNAREKNIKINIPHHILPLILFSVIIQSV